MKNKNNEIYEKMQKDAEKLSKDSNGLKQRDTGLGVRIADTFKGATSRNEYTAFLTNYARMDGLTETVKEVRRNGIKKIQKVVNLASTQKLMFSLGAEATLDKKVRLVKANKKLLEQKLVSKAQVKAKEYLFLETKIETLTFDEKLKNLMDTFDMTNEKVIARLNAITK